MGGLWNVCRMAQRVLLGCGLERLISDKQGQMTDEELFELDAEPQWQRVLVTASDYSYEGWLVSVFQKRRGSQSAKVIRCVVEDENGRLFIHGAEQLTKAQ